jgi:hypothetical protein
MFYRLKNAHLFIIVINASYNRSSRPSKPSPSFCSLTHAHWWPFLKHARNRGDIYQRMKDLLFAVKTRERWIVEMIYISALLIGKQSLFIPRISWNPQIHAVGKMQVYWLLKQITKFPTTEGCAGSLLTTGSHQQASFCKNLEWNKTIHILHAYMYLNIKYVDYNQLICLVQRNIILTVTQNFVLSISPCFPVVMRMRGNGVIIPPHDSSIRHVGITEWRKLKSVSLEFVTYGMTSIPNFMTSLTVTILLKNVNTRLQLEKRFGWVGLGRVRLVMRMRRGSWLMTSSPSFHLATLSMRHDGITKCRKLESTSMELWPMT